MKETEIKEIDWGLFENKWVKFENGEPKDLALTNWKQLKKEINGTETVVLGFDVQEENGNKTEKVLEVTSKKLAQQLKPLIKRAQEQNKNQVKCRITRVGEKFDTHYSVKEI